MESGVTRERVERGEREWHRWKEEGKGFQKKIGSIESNTGQRSGTLAESAFRAVPRFFLLGGWIWSGIIQERVERGERGWGHWKKDTSGFSDVADGIQ